MTYAIFKALHLFGAFAWMAAAWYLPRILIYHFQSADQANNKANPNIHATFTMMALRLSRFIMMPAMTFTWVVGIFFVSHSMVFAQSWFHVKLLCVLLLTVYSIFLAWLCRAFSQGRWVVSDKALRWINEIPTVILIAILFVTVVYSQW